MPLFINLKVGFNSKVPEPGQRYVKYYYYKYVLIFRSNGVQWFKRFKHPVGVSFDASGCHGRNSGCGSSCASGRPPSRQTKIASYSDMDTSIGTILSIITVFYSVELNTLHDSLIFTI
jgi:hypothetical protein